MARARVIRSHYEQTLREAVEVDDGIECVGTEEHCRRYLERAIRGLGVAEANYESNEWGEHHNVGPEEFCDTLTLQVEGVGNGLSI